MNTWTAPSFLLLLAAFDALLPGCKTAATGEPEASLPENALPDASRSAQVCDVRVIALAGPAAAKSNEFSGLAWHGDTLILLPQYADKTGQGGAVYSLTREQLTSYLQQKSPQALTPKLVPFSVAGLRQKVPGFEGFESIAFAGDRVFVTVEAHESSGMKSYLVAGTTDPQTSKLELDTEHLTPISAQAPIGNMADEAIVFDGQKLFSFYEANGVNVNPNPISHGFGMDLTPAGSLPFPHLEYRVTDATSPDSDGRFWVINYFYPGDASALKPASDPLAEKWAPDLRASKNGAVERLVQLQFTEQGVRLVERAPIWLRVPQSEDSHNWEGIARLDDGFLLITDTYPTTVFGYVKAEP